MISLSAPIGNTRGSFFIIVIFAMLAMIGIAGLAIDLGFSQAVKMQLQNAADAAALAGSGVIYPANTSGLTTFPAPDFISASSTATAFVKKNAAAGAYLTDGNIVTVTAGYWNLRQNPPSMQQQNITPKGICSTSGNVCTSYSTCPATESCLIQDVPAVQVTVNATVPTFVVKSLGLNSLTPAATAIAVRGYAKNATGAFPLAITKCIADYYFSQTPFPNPPLDIPISSPYGPKVAGCYTGQWTSFTLDTNDVPTIRNLMDGRDVPSLRIGEPIWIQPGTKATIYQEAQSFIGKTVEVPVVADASLTHAENTITGFATMKIMSVTPTGPTKSVTVQFLAYYTNNDARPGGGLSNTVTPPVLVK